MAVIQTSLIIKTLDVDTPISKTLSNVNPEANFEKLDSFARKFTALSTQTYVDSYRIDKQSVNENLALEQEGE